MIHGYTRGVFLGLVTKGCFQVFRTMGKVSQYHHEAGQFCRFITQGKSSAACLRASSRLFRPCATQGLPPSRSQPSPTAFTLLSIKIHTSHPPPCLLTGRVQLCTNAWRKHISLHAHAGAEKVPSRCNNCNKNDFFF